MDVFRRADVQGLWKKARNGEEMEFVALHRSGSKPEMTRQPPVTNNTSILSLAHTTSSFIPSFAPWTPLNLGE